MSHNLNHHELGWLQSWALRSVVVGLGLSLSGCQCWGPSGTCLPPDGLIAHRADALRQQHLERSHYHRDVPMFEQYLAGGTDGHQQLPSRFHPVPTRNVFQSPMTAGTSPVDASRPTYGSPSAMDRVPRETNTQELPPPQPTPFGTDSQSLEPSVTPPLRPMDVPPVELGPQASPELLHRQMVQYPLATDPQQQVADWVRGNYGTGAKESLRLHSALGPSGTDRRWR
jgi:hypothetical protein